VRTAIFALTPEGGHLALRLCDAMTEAFLFLPERIQHHIPAKCSVQYFKRLSEVICTAFTRYDVLVFVMATGIVVRMIAPYVKSKLYDPAVLVFDEQGQHGISLLSGHIGGANTLTKKLCSAVGADPVITTATDVTGRLAPDAVAAQLALRPVPKRAIQILNTALLEGRRIKYLLDIELLHGEFYTSALSREDISVVPFHNVPPLPSDGEYHVIITSAVYVPQETEIPEHTLYLVPRRLIAGVGCRAGVPEEDILHALTEACRMIDRDISWIDFLASTEVKSNEAGLLAAARTLDRDICFYTQDELMYMVEKYGLIESNFVKKTIGVGNVSEAAALCAAGKEGGRIALGKTIFGKVTVALLWEK
jgi:cobalamin biosynthesis protein cbiG